MSVRKSTSPYLAKKKKEAQKKLEKDVEKTADALEGKKPRRRSVSTSATPVDSAGKPADSGKKNAGKQSKMDDDGAIVDAEDEPEEAGTMTQSQAKVVAELSGIVLKNGQRVFALKLNSPAFIKDMTRIWNEQRNFMLAFKVPVEKKDGEVTKWKTVEFPTKLIDLSLKGKDSATCHGHIDHAGAVAMSELILNWKGGVEFLLDGVQQSMF